jgi:hypothetical protein
VAAAGFVKRQQWSTEKGFQPRLLTKQLMQAQQVEQLQQLWQQHQSDFNAVHFSALMHQLSVLHQAAAAGVQQTAQQPEQQVQRSRRARQRQQQTDEAAGMTHEAIASVAVAAAASAAVSSDKQYADLEDELLHLVEEFSSSTNGPNGSVDLDSQLDTPPQQQQQQQQQKLVRPSQPNSQQWEQQKLHRQQLTAQQLAHTVAAYALSPSIRQQLDARAVAMISHALAKVGLQDQQLLAGIVQATALEAGLLNQLDAQQLCNLIWSVAVCVDSVNGVSGPYMARELAFSSSSSQQARPGNGKPNTAPGASSSGNVQQQAPAASTSSSSSSLSLHQYELPKAWLSGVERAFGYKVGDASSAGLAMAVWGFCRLGLRPGPWLRAFFEKSGSQLHNFSSQELAMVAYALGKLKAEVRMLAVLLQLRDGQQQQWQAAQLGGWPSFGHPVGLLRHSSIHCHCYWPAGSALVHPQHQFGNAAQQVQGAFGCTIMPGSTCTI